MITDIPQTVPLMAALTLLNRVKVLSRITSKCKLIIIQLFFFSNLIINLIEKANIRSLLKSMHNFRNGCIKYDKLYECVNWLCLAILLTCDYSIIMVYKHMEDVVKRR